MARPAHKNPSADTARRRSNRAKWREARRFTGFSFEVGMYDHAKATWEKQRGVLGAALVGRASFTDWVAASINAFEQRNEDEQVAFLNDYMQRAAAPKADAVPTQVDDAPSSPTLDEAPFDFNSLAEMSNTAEATS